MQLGELLDRRELIKGDAFFRETGAGGERVPVSVLRADRQCAEPATRGLTPFGDGGQSPLANPSAKALGALATAHYAHQRAAWFPNTLFHPLSQAIMPGPVLLDLDRAEAGACNLLDRERRTQQLATAGQRANRRCADLGRWPTYSDELHRLTPG